MNISGLGLALEPEVYLFGSSSRDESFRECGKAHLLQQSLLTSMKPALLIQSADLADNDRVCIYTV